MGTTLPLARPLEAPRERARGEIPRPFDLTRLSRIAAAVTIALGATGLGRWSIDGGALRLGERTVIDPGSGIGFVMSGVAIWLLARPHASLAAPRFARALGALVVTGALAAASPLGLGIATPALPISLAFIALGSALVMLEPRPLRAWAAQILALVVSGIAAFVLLARVFVGEDAIPGAPPRSAVAFLVAALGVLCAVPSEGATALVTSSHAGGTVGRRLLFAALAIPAVGLVVQLGRRLELFDAPMALALLTALAAAISMGSALHTARAAARTDRERERVSADRMRLASLVDSADDAIVAATPEGIVVHWNDAAERLYGHREIDMIGRALRTIVPPDLDDEHTAWIERVRRGEHVGSRETVLRRRDGSRIPVSLTLSPILDGHAEVVGVSAIARDLGDRIAMENALRRSEEQFRAVFEDASDAILLADTGGHYTDANAAACAMLGYRRDELVGKTLLELIAPEDATRLREAREALFPGGAQISEWSMRARDGEYVPVEMSATILRDGRWQGLMRDVSARRAAEEAARDAESIGARGSRQRAFIEAAIEQIVDAIWITDEHGAVVLRNDAARALERRAASNGASSDEAPALEGRLQLPSGQALFPDESPIARALSERMTIAPIPLRARTRDGDVLEIAMGAAPVVDGTRVLGAVAMVEVRGVVPADADDAPTDA